MYVCMHDKIEIPLGIKDLHNMQQILIYQTNFIQECFNAVFVISSTNYSAV